ncbi:hypothetical protein [Limnohabitans sp. Rim8]|uniref:hypothetical protein n=1 Tax=Limnohabitans sp. Rim8 TaxID=1100718 RepID=UPI0026311DD1|nr:hypothetical protein [Limnohabitans sp. Rim8]
MSKHLVFNRLSSVVKLTSALGLSVVLTACVVPPHQGYGYSNSSHHQAYSQPTTVFVQPRPVHVQPWPVHVQPRPVHVQPQPVYVQPRPVHVQPNRPIPVIPKPVGVPHRHEGGWSWNTSQRERLERRSDAPRHVF